MVQELTQKEIKIHRELVSNLLVREIAEKYGTTEQVIKNVARQIYKKREYKNGRTGLLFHVVEILRKENEELKNKLNPTPSVQV